jgi:hypothetical protein
MRKTSLVFALLFASPLFAGTVYWYNGDSDGFATKINEVGGSSGTGLIYDDFVVGSGGVNITGVFSNDLVLNIPSSGADTNAPGVVTQASWEIRSGVSAGNAGTLLDSGTASATQTATGLTFNSGAYAVYDIQITGLNVNLGPGTYWLAVAPDFGASTSYNSYIATTYGFNGVGTPKAQDGNSFWNDPGFGDDFVAAVTATGADSADGTNNVDFSMGVDGTVATIPEPGTAGLGAGALFLLGLAAAARRFRN